MTRPRRVTAPASDIIDMAFIEQHSRTVADGGDLSRYIAAAVSHMDGYAGILGRAMMTQTWAVDLSGFPASGKIRLPLGDLVAVTGIVYRDAAGTSQTLAAETYSAHQDDYGPYVRLGSGLSWPSTATRDDAVTITWTCGYGPTPSDVPQALRHAAVMLTAHFYEHREAVSEGRPLAPTPMGVDALVTPYRAVHI
jgi:uncharacterized phiE125 gp8 family phage protein